MCFLAAPHASLLLQLETNGTTTMHIEPSRNAMFLMVMKNSPMQSALAREFLKRPWIV
jgi:hypothetical protein